VSPAFSVCAEATGDNVFIVRNNVIYVPPVEAGSLEGITRAVVIRLARKEGLEIVEKNLTRFDLYVCDEFFLTGTAAEVPRRRDRRPTIGMAPGRSRGSAGAFTVRPREEQS
jgi:branched-chain amino acid aminotransferase